MLENDTLVAPFGKEDAAAESQSHAARTQETLVNAVENAEVTEIIRAVFCAFDTSQELQRRRNPTRLPDLKHSPQGRTMRPSDTKPCHTSSRQRLLQVRMTKKKGKDVRRAGAVNAARRAGETVETKRAICRTLSSSTQVNIEIDPSCQH